MIDWITNLTVLTVLACNLLLGNIYSGTNQVSSLSVEQLNALPSSEIVAIAENPYKDSRKDDFRRFREITKGTTKLEGLFTLYHQEEDRQFYLEIKPAQLNKNYLGIVTLESGIGERGLYSGQSLSEDIFYFQRVNDYVQFTIRNVKFRTEPGKPEQLALARSFTDSVLFALPIVSIDPYSKSILVDLGDLLMQDFPGLTSLLKYALNANYNLDDSKSYFGNVKSFPRNLEIDSIYNFSSSDGAYLVTVPDSRAITLKVHYSFSELSENNGYIPRVADDRVGYFITAYQDLSNDDRAEPFVRYINRWHLEPSDPEAALSPPKKPIVFWIENAVPLEYREAIREGVLMWNRAFEKAGFQNAIEVRQMPDNADWHPADVRYNTIRWFNSLDASFARGPSHVNPFTGEILDADIVVDANMVRLVKQEYRTLKEDGLFPQFDRNLCQPKQASYQPILADNHSCYDIEISHQAAMGAITLSMLHNATPDSDEMKDYVHQYLRSVIAHEVGHTLGLRHNFHGSTMLSPDELNNVEITRTKGLVSSVMDYLPVNLAAPGMTQGDYFPGVVGPYDEWAIIYGYQPDLSEKIEEIVVDDKSAKSFVQQIAFASPQPELGYATDEDVWDINPDANLWDLSSDVLLYSQWQMDNARLMWERLEKRQPLPGESFSSTRGLFNKILSYYFLNANLITKYVGGQSFRRDRVFDDRSWAFVPVTVEKQRQALATLQSYIFAEDALIFSPQLLNQLAPSRWQHWGNPVPVSRLDYPIHERILLLQSTILRSLLSCDRLERLRDIELKTLPGEALTIPELFDTLQNSIWTEVFGEGKLTPISSVRRSLQREHLSILLSMVLRTSDVPEDGRMLAWYELRQLEKVLHSSLQKHGANLDLYTKAHLEESCDRIAKALNAPLRSL
ncbi:MAG TPA: zinc-dependent metalloprotease [Leptolyngbyaceae cyanobacterium]